MSTENVQRTEEDLFKSLLDHLKNLKEAIGNFKSSKEERYCKIIASELRVLICDTRSNKPLLTNLAKIKGIELVIHRDVPPMKKAEVKLVELLEEFCFFSGVTNNRVSNKQLILYYSEQEGCSHEDWKHSQEYVELKGDGFFIGGIKPNNIIMVNLGQCIYSCGMRFLDEIFKSRVI